MFDHLYLAYILLFSEGDSLIKVWQRVVELSARWGTCFQLRCEVRQAGRFSAKSRFFSRVEGKLSRVHKFRRFVYYPSFFILLITYFLNIFFGLLFCKISSPFSIWPKYNVRMLLFAFRAFPLFNLPKVCSLKRGFVISRYLFIDLLITGEKNVVPYTYTEDLVI